MITFDLKLEIIGGVYGNAAIGKNRGERKSIHSDMYVVGQRWFFTHWLAVGGALSSYGRQGDSVRFVIFSR